MMTMILIMLFYFCYDHGNDDSDDGYDNDGVYNDGYDCLYYTSEDDDDDGDKGDHDDIRNVNDVMVMFWVLMMKMIVMMMMKMISTLMIEMMLMMLIVNIQRPIRYGPLEYLNEDYDEII